MRTKLDLLIDIVEAAGHILQHRHGSFEQVIDEHATRLDVDLQMLIIEKLSVVEELKTVPLLVEEQQPEVISQIERRWPDIVLCQPTKLPSWYISVDPLDGSALASNNCPEISISLALVQRSRGPNVAAVCVPHLGITAAALRGQECLVNGNHITLTAPNDPSWSLIGLDMCKSVPQEFRRDVIDRLINTFWYPRNLPSVASGIELLLGRTAAWISDRAKNWDVAATALCITAAGGTADALCSIPGGYTVQPIPWNRVEMPPLLFTAGPSVRDYVLEQLAYCVDT